MTTLVWLFFSLSCFASGYLTYRVTSWSYRRKMRRCLSCRTKLAGS